MKDALKRTAPGWLLAVYRRIRQGGRRAARALSPTRACRVRQLVIRIGVSSDIEEFRAETYGSKEPETLDWLDGQLQDGDVFMDVGANVGLYSLYAAMARPKSRVYAFEPESQNFARLCRNLALNGVLNVVPCNLPLAGREGFDWFEVSSLEPGSALHSFAGPGAFQTAGGQAVLRQGALAVTLDALVCKYGVPQPALLKIDVDGTEEAILDGAEAVLASPQLRSLLVEVTDRGDGRGGGWAERKLERFGFRAAGGGAWTDFRGLRSQNQIFQRSGRPGAS